MLNFSKIFDRSATNIDQMDHDSKRNDSKAHYFSINSTSIAGVHYGTKQFETESYKNNIRLNSDNLFDKQSFAFFYFEFNHFFFLKKDAIRPIYPELNIIMVVEINDNKETQEKITFNKGKDDKGTYFTLKNKADKHLSYSRVIIPLPITNKKAPIKLNFIFYTYANYKLLNFCNSEIYLSLKSSDEMKKFKLYQNVYAKYNNTKMGNLMFHFSYCVNDIYYKNLEKEKSMMLYKLSVKYK
jgi:hypothetical protein